MLSSQPSRLAGDSLDAVDYGTFDRPVRLEYDALIITSGVS